MISRSSEVAIASMISMSNPVYPDGAEESGYSNGSYGASVQTVSLPALSSSGSPSAASEPLEPQAERASASVAARERVLRVRGVIHSTLVVRQVTRATRVGSGARIETKP